MINPYLIQRLGKPLGQNPKPTTPWTFGGGYIDGGMTKGFLEAIKYIFRFDYMGAAEFEFGAVPRAFKTIIENRKKSNLSAGKLKLKTPIYYISPKDCEEEVAKYIYLLAKKGDCYKKRGDKFHSIWLKEWTNLKRQIDSGDVDNTHGTFGWLELDTGFMFFIDKEMFENTLKIFGLELNGDVSHENDGVDEK